MKLLPTALFAALLVSVTSAGARSPTDDVADMLRRFYGWYIPQVQRSNQPANAEMSQLVTDRLLGRIARLSKDKNGEAPALDYDPFVNAQDVSADWARNIGIGDVKITADSAAATVRLSGEMSSTIHVKLVRSRGKWKIDNFSPRI
jgi:hypothetical protein